MRPPRTAFEPHDSVVFLALCWAGGGPFALVDVIHAYDWINHDVLGAHDMRGALNRLLAAGLVEIGKGTYAVPKAVRDAFDTFRKRRREGRFAAAAAFLKRSEPLPTTRRRVRLTESTYRKALDAYHRAFAEALAQLEGSSRRRTGTPGRRRASGPP